MKLNIIAENSPTVIITSYKANDSNPINRKNFGSLIKDIYKLKKKFRFKSGKWKGKKEPALIVYGLTLDQAKKLMIKYDQEAIVYNGSIKRINDI